MSYHDNANVADGVEMNTMDDVNVVDCGDSSLDNAGVADKQIILSSGVNGINMADMGDVYLNINRTEHHHHDDHHHYYLPNSDVNIAASHKNIVIHAPNAERVTVNGNNNSIIHNPSNVSKNVVVNSAVEVVHLKDRNGEIIIVKEGENVVIQDKSSDWFHGVYVGNKEIIGIQAVHGPSTVTSHSCDNIVLIINLDTLSSVYSREEIKNKVRAKLGHEYTGHYWFNNYWDFLQDVYVN